MPWAFGQGRGFVKHFKGLALACGLMAAVIAASPALAQTCNSESGCIVETVIATQAATPKFFGVFTPLGFSTVTAIGVAAVAPMIGTIVLGHELSPSEFWHMELTLFFGPFGPMLADRMFPPGQNGGPPGPGNPGQGPPTNINLPPPGAPFVPNEILLEVDSGTPARYLARLGQRLGLTLIQSQSFGLSGRTLLQFQINNGRSVISVLRSLAQYARISAAQPNYLYLLQQGAPAVTRDVPRDSTVVQYVVDKLHLREAHEITNGDDVVVAVIDSQVDVTQPELAGSIAGSFDATGQPPAPHPHGTAIAGAIAAHAKLIGIAPKVKLLTARVFTGNGESAQASTFNILKGIDWAASQNARILNMSFAGPNDPMIRNMISKAHARGLVIIAAVGNAGPRAPPLYPAAYADVIGVTATDVDDKLMPQANRGRQVAVSAPGVDIVAPAPADTYQITSGTSVAAAHVSGVAALLLARDPKLTPNALKKILTASAHGLGRPAQEVGAGEIDALSALRALQK